MKFLYKRHSKDKPQKKPLYVVIYGKCVEEVKKPDKQLELREGEDLATWEARLCASYRELVEDTDAFVQHYTAISSRLKVGKPEMIEPVITLSSGSSNFAARDNMQKVRFSNDYIHGLRYRYWQLLLTHPYYRLFDAPTKTEYFNKKLNQMENYDLNEFNLKNFRADFEADVFGLVRRAVIDVFAHFVKKNPWCFNDEAVREYVGWNGVSGQALRWPTLSMNFDAYSGYGETRLDMSHTSFRIECIERVLALFDLEWTTPRCCPSRVVEDAVKLNEKKMNFTYFSATFFKNGTCKLKFHPDTKLLIDRFNIYVGLQQGWLPTTYGRKPYAELSVVEKKVVDSFQGETFYEEVCAKPDLYLMSVEQLVEAAKK